MTIESGKSVTFSSRATVTEGMPLKALQVRLQDRWHSIPVKEPKTAALTQE